MYSINPYKLIVSVDNSICDYYKSLIPKHHYVQKQKYAPHISVVRNETPTNLNTWNKYVNKQIIFEYESFIHNDETYYWLNAYSELLEDIRVELGLPSLSEYTKSPDGKHKFHITIGNIKHIKWAY